MEQDALVAVDIGDRALAAGGRGEAGIVGEHAGLGVELADVDDVRADRAVQHRIVMIRSPSAVSSTVLSVIHSAPPSGRRCGRGFRSCPSRASTSKIPGEVVRPVSAARSGWASLPSLTPVAFRHLPHCSIRARHASQFGTAASASCASASRARASSVEQRGGLLVDRQAAASRTGMPRLRPAR